MNIRGAARKIIAPARRAVKSLTESPLRPRNAGAGVFLKVTSSKLNPAWGRTERGQAITVEKKPLIHPGAKVFAMGSCFALEIRDSLARNGFDVLPRYSDITLDPARQKVDNLPDRDNISYYDTFTIRQEFEAALGEAAHARDSFWEVKTLTVKSGTGLDTPHVFQDPSRKRVFAATMEDLSDATRKLDACIRDGIKRADVYILTLGLIEVWRDKKSGRYLSLAPAHSQMDDAEFILSDFESNVANMRRVCGLLREHAPGRPVIITISPVPLSRTYTRGDIIVANLESKSLLRTVASQIAREFDNVTYWPSYEIASREDIFEEDGRHVRPESVDKIIGAFIEAHCQD